MNIIRLLLITVAILTIKTKLVYAADITITDINASCTTSCGTQSVAGNFIANISSISATEPFDVGASNAETTINCQFACEKAKQRASGTYVADVKASPTSNSFTRVMCNALRVVQGSAGKTFAAFAIIAVGIGFFSGKVSWGLMIGVAAGIAAMFGAPSIVAAISGENTNMSCGNKI